MLLEADTNEHVEVQPKLFGIEQRYILANETARFQRAHPRQAGRGREVHALGQLHVGQAGVFLKFFQNLQIGAVKIICAVSFHIGSILCCQFALRGRRKTTTARATGLQCFDQENPINDVSKQLHFIDPASADPDPGETAEWREALFGVSSFSVQ